MQFRVLGTLEVEARGVDLTPARPKQRALLALLLLHAGKVVHTDDLVEALWGERPPQTAQSALHGHIYALRKRLGAERIETRPPGYLLRLLDGDDLDLHRFERAVSETHSNRTPGRSEMLREALALFRGEPLADFRYEDFARHERGRLEELRLGAVEERIEADLELGRHIEVLPELERLVSAHPLRERLRALQMLALYRAGRQGDALHAFGEARLALAAELGVEPGPALRRLEGQILNHDPELAPQGLFGSAPGEATGKPVGIVTLLYAETDDPVRPVHELRAVAERHGGHEVDTRGNSFLGAFSRARDAVAAAAAIQQTAGGNGLVRVGIDTVEAAPTADGYVGPGVRAAAAICRAAHPGQILLSGTTRDLLREAALDEARLRDAGQHRLDDLAPPRRLFQLSAPGLNEDFPPPRGLDARPTNLLVQPMPLVGRTRELGELKDLLSRADVRLATLTGAAGAGKTRLAVHAAAELLDQFADGVFFVPLAPLTDPDLVLPTVARTLGVPETPGRTAAEALADHIGAGRLLLVLDNFEHLLGAATAAGVMVEAVPGLKLLVTSRVPLRVADERVYPVQPLETPSGGEELDRLLRMDSVALFLSRARVVRADFAATAESAEFVAGICRALDGLPLAIELAATRVGVLPPAALLARLEDRLKLLTGGSVDAPARHRTLRSAIEWSYDLLDTEHQRLFLRLAVFAGGCTLRAAEAVCGEDLDVIDGLASLMDSSLLRVEGDDAEPRFGMLETIRDYAAAQLEQSGERETLQRRHAEYFLELAEQAEPSLRGSPGEWLDRLERDYGNFRVALDRLHGAGETELLLRLAAALWRFWYLRGYLTEGRRWIECALQADEGATTARANALNGAAVMAVNSADPANGRLRAQEALTLHERLGDAWGAAYSRFMLAAAVGNEGDLAAARELYEGSVRVFQELGDEHSTLLATRHLALTCAALGDRRRARALHEDNLRRARESGNARMEASALGALAMIAVDEGRVEDSLELLKGSLRIHCDLGDLLDTGVDLCRAAFVLAFEGKGVTATRLLSTFDSHREQMGSRHSGAAELNAQTLATVRTQLDAAAFDEAWKEGGRLTLREAAALARDSLG